jgi:hypothetical protein
VAPVGGTVAVAGGVYSANWVAGGAAVIYPDAAHDASGAAPVTFVCQGSGDVTFDSSAPNFTFYPGVANVTFSGGCFRFHVVHFGYGGYAAQTRNVVVSGAKMDSFECAGCANVTIRNSEVGPMVACYGAGQNVPASQKCDAGSPAERYWSTLPLGSSNQTFRPYIHRGAAGVASSVTLSGDYVHDIQTRNAAAMHMECLQVWGVKGLVLRGNRFFHCGVFDVFFSSDDVEDDVTIENNFFAAPVEPLDAADAGAVTGKSWREVVVKSFAGTTLSNWLIRFNSFDHGLSLDNSAVGQKYSNARVIGNVLGNWSYCVPGVLFDYNASVRTRLPCDRHLRRLSSFPYVRPSTGNLHLARKAGLSNVVPKKGRDYSIGSDLDSQRRPMGSARDIGADEAR